MTSSPCSASSIAVAAVAAALAIAYGPARADNCVVVEVQNIRPGQGSLMVAAYADSASFDKKQEAGLKTPAGDAATKTLTLCGVSGREISLTLYQDLNDNGKLDTNVFGIPTEPWGASGKPAAMSAPTWASTTVPLDDKTIVVKLSK